MFPASSTSNNSGARSSRRYLQVTIGRKTEHCSRRLQVIEPSGVKLLKAGMNCWLVPAKALRYVFPVRKLTTEMLLNGYCCGAFPMAVNARGDIRWFAPDPRGIIPLDERFHIPHGLKRTLKKQPFNIEVDRAFDQVMHHCSTSHGETWISAEIIRAYCELHALGFAHSVEAWQDGKLVGGLYGVHIRGAFFGESMFHHVTDASKCALVALVERLRKGGFALLDTQWITPHLQQFGACEIPKADYHELLNQALEKDCQF